MSDILLKLKWFDDTLAFCRIDVDNSPAEVVKEVLYGDFAVSVHTFFHFINLEPLLEARLISADLMELCLGVREKVAVLTEAQTVAGDIRKDQQWASIIAMCKQGQRIRQKLG